MDTDTPMDTDVVGGDPMETNIVEGTVEGGSDTDLARRCADSDDDSYTKTVNRMMLFSYEIPGMRTIDDYSQSAYPWEEPMEAGGRAGFSMLVLKVKRKREGREGRWDEQSRMRMVKSKVTSALPIPMVDQWPEMVVDLCPGNVDARLSPCSMDEVVAVRVKMNEYLEKGTSYRCLFKSQADVEDLCFKNDHDEPYWQHVLRYQRKSTTCVPSYAHIFPDVETVTCLDWIKPTTFKGDKQYLEFFQLLMEVTEYGHTKDHVLATAIVLAKEFQKMLFFQINIAVQDCMELVETEESMRQRYDLYYSIVSQVVLNDMDCKSLISSIRAGESGLPFNLTEFSAPDIHIWEGVIMDTVDCLVSHLRTERARGLYKEWVYDKADRDVANLVADMVDKQFRSNSRGLYAELLLEKMGIANDLGLLLSETAA